LFAHEQAVDTIEQAQQQSRTRFFWFVNYLSDYSDFDFLWEPVPWEAEYTHAWPTEWDQVYGMYLVPKDKEIKYHYRTEILTTKQYPENYKIEVDAEFDTAWVPHPWDPPYIYVFGNQHWPGEIMPTVEYHMPGATERKYLDWPQATLVSNKINWEICEDIDIDTWDWSWIPNPKDPPYIYVWGNQWNPPEFKASVKYIVPGAIEVKYMSERTTRSPQPEKFKQIKPVVDFDYSWEPNPLDPPYNYVFGNQWNPGPAEPTLEYAVPGAKEIKYVDLPVAKLAGDSSKFTKYHDCDFDYSWEPWRLDPGAPPFIYVFGNQHWPVETMPTIEYAVPGATERKYLTELTATLLPTTTNWITQFNCEFDYSWHPEPGSPPYIYVFGNQWWPAEKMPTVEYHMPDATERKYMSVPEAKLLIDMTRWQIPPNVDTRDMDFSWVPDPGEPPYIYQFATQWQKTGGPQYHVPGGTEFKYVDMMRVEVVREAAPIIEIDHLDGNAGQVPGVIKKVRYFDNYRDTLIRLAKSLLGEHEFVWVCSSICDYTDFDFSWHPEKWQGTMLHVFASNEQKFGDTFYMHVPTFAARAEKKALLEWYSVNYVPKIRVPRRPMPVIHHTADSHVDVVKNTTWSGPLATFTTSNTVQGNMFTVPLWRKETKTIVPLSKGAASVIVPRVAVGDICTQLYDYPYINKTQRVGKEHPLDIVFISNGEKYAGFHEQQLCRSVQRDGLDCNHIHHSAGVNGRVAAYQAAARSSTTPWFFAVFAKLEVDPKFDWSWQPDRMQQPKHYIFHAYNPVNGLTYGHQAMIAYNKKMVLENAGTGLDFTLDQPHEVVPVLSGVANYNETPWMAWRTAFREVLKLKASLPDVESEYRLRMWLSNAGEVPNAEWSQWGAEDAVEYYDEVAGDFTALKKSYEWSWLASYAFMRRSLQPDR